MAVGARARKLERLTPEQEALMATVRDEWMGVGLSVAPADRAGAEEGVRLAYRAAGLSPPRIVVWLDSPLAGCIGATILQNLPPAALHGARPEAIGDQVRDQVGDQVGDQVWGQVWDQVWDQVRGQVRGQVGDQVWGQVWDQVRDQVWGQVWDQVRDQVGDQVWDQVRDQVGDQVWGQVRGQVWDQVRDQVWGQLNYVAYGQHDASWLAFYDFFRRCSINVDALAGLMQVARCAGWWWPMRDAVVLTERPRELNHDAQHRLHSLDGPALHYPDGWAIYAIHGVRLNPAQEYVVTEPARITADAITQEPNAEVRRVMVDRLGYDRYLTQLGAVPISRDDWGTLWRVDYPDDEPLVLVELVNSTPEPDGTRKRYFQGVPERGGAQWTSGRGCPAIRTAHAAVAWLYGCTPDQYRPAVET